MIEGVASCVDNASSDPDGHALLCVQVLTLLCKARLAASDAGAGLEAALAALEAEAPGATAAEPELQLVFVEARVAAGRLTEALRFLVDLVKGGSDLAAPDGGQVADTFLTGLRLALPVISHEALPSYQSAVR